MNDCGLSLVYGKEYEYRLSQSGKVAVVKVSGLTVVYGMEGG